MNTTQSPRFELVFNRIINAAPAQVFRAWTDPELMTQWFTPAPWKTVHAEVDLRPGGSNLIVMQDPDGQEYPNRGVYLEVVPNQRLVVTDAYTRAWEPSEKPFMTLVLTFEATGDGKTNYTARALHWTEADLESHKQMGFQEGWGKATDQMEALLARLAGAAS